MASVFMGMNMTMLNARSKIFKKLLKKEAGEHEQPNQLDPKTLPIEFRQNVDHGNRKKVRTREDQQKPEVCVLTFRNKEDQKTRNKRCEEQYQ